MSALFNIDRVSNRLAFRYPQLFFCVVFFLVPIVGLALVALAVFIFSFPLCILFEKLALASLFLQ